MVDSGLAKLGYDYINTGSLLRFVIYVVTACLFSFICFLVEKEI
jgi:hypothetical protein